MAKIAGRKNDGAWYRANKVISSLSSEEQAALSTMITGMDSISSWFEAMIDLAENAGLVAGAAGIPESTEDLAIAYAEKGIPRQAWYGRLSYDIYAKVGEGDEAVYTPVHQATAHEFGKELRKLMKDFVFSRRQALDMGNIRARDQGNPGGIADATEGN